ncbi:MAG: hypothetical protein GXP41_01665 [Chloroflexi bacterium]|nr:hypothetical protein [Chloroflexota bacterium]
MSRWWEKLRGRPLYGLLEEDDPPVRYFTLTKVLERPLSAPAVRRAHAALAHAPAIRLLRQELGQLDGHLVAPPYRALLWAVSLLATFGADGRRDETIATACDLLLARALQPATTGEAQSFLDAKGELRAEALPWAAIAVRAIARLGFAGDARVRALFARLLAYPALDGSRGLCPRHQAAPCADCLALILDAIVAWPPDRHSAEVVSWPLPVVDWLLSQPLASLPAHWLRPAFPTFDWPDLLFAARTLVDLGYAEDARFQPWVEFIVQAQDDAGGWSPRRSVSSPDDWSFLDRSTAQKWTTWQALHVIHAAYGD